MTCSLCLVATPELQTIDASGHCPLCGADYSSWLHVYRVRPSRGAWDETYKLRPQGIAYRDKLVAARINLRKETV